MPSKISRYSEGIMEAVWLAAIIVIPVFFNVYSSRIFEPDKITLLRTLALIALAAWIVKLVDGGVKWGTIQPGESKLRTLLRVPLLLPVALMALSYIISTIFSVTPATSLWGSYQRLQGTYTTFSYIVIFATIAGNLRRRAQVERLITAAVIASLPVSLYGVLQRYRLDPIPWGGDVSARIAANMGNPIFVAAYLIMAFPLTLLRIVESFESLVKDDERLGPNFLRATAYVFIGALEMIAIFLSGSRGPWLGLAVSLVIVGLGLSLIWKKRWMTVSGVVLALLAAVFLVVLNIPNGPLESMRQVPGIGRLGQLLDAESRTGRVRTLIWQGAAELVQPHAPLHFPDGSTDRFNVLRPLIGYGPESMYVAYSPFYPPELTQVEKRNATPDRSHNETWDSLVITGVFGLLAYLFLFGSVIYYGLKWLGLIPGRGERSLFLALFVFGGLVSAVGFVLWRGVNYFGVALPFGMVIGVMLYLLWAALFGRYEAPRTAVERARAYTLLALLAVVAGHWVEINFGIAIVSTRTDFWTFAALILVVGYLLPKAGEYGAARSDVALVESEAAPLKEQPVQRKKRRAAPSRQARETASPGGWPAWLRHAMLAGVIVGILLGALGYDLTSNAQGDKTALAVFINSLTHLRNSLSGNSYGVLALVLTSWLVGVAVLVSEDAQDKSAQWLKMLGVALGVSLVLGMFFWLWHAGGMASLARATANTMDDVLRQVGRYENLLTKFYTFLLLMIFGAAALLPQDWPARATSRGWTSTLVAPLALIVALALASFTNLRVIQADIAFKLAEPFARAPTWPVAIAVYQQANALAPAEDYYYLFLGRAYLEHAKSLTTAEDRDRVIAQAADDLRKAQILNPLNTDHTANLGRLYSLWAGYTTDPAQRMERAAQSSGYFERALQLSPNNARLWDEWGVMLNNVMRQPDEALKRYNRSLEIDPYYDWTYALIGDLNLKAANEITGAQDPERVRLLEAAAEAYQQALQVTPSDPNNPYSYAYSLGNVLAQLGRLDEALASYQKALDALRIEGERWRPLEQMARVAAQKGDLPLALQFAQNSAQLAPDDQKARLQDLAAQIQGQIP